MYDQAPTTIPIRSMTGANVGPSTYVICVPRSTKQNCAPFLSSEAKKLSCLKTQYTDAIYDTRGLSTDIRGGSCLRNKTPRFVYIHDDLPSPARYNPVKPIHWPKKKLKLDPTKPKLYACAVPYTTTVIAPSIPSKADQNGYELDEKGHILCKIPPDKLKPTEINIKSGLGAGLAGRWSCRTSERFSKKHGSTPGPGPAAYMVQVPACRKSKEEESVREMARRFSFVPRFVEAQEMKSRKQKRPGPGYYDIDSNSATKDKCESVNPRPFIRGAERFSDMTKVTPGPGDYHICDCYRAKKDFSKKCSPFGIDAQRFEKKKLEDLPGPASYDIKGAIQEKLEKKKNPFAVCITSFNSTAHREIVPIARDAACTPSPAEYPEDKPITEEEEIENECRVTSSVFLNNVCRFFSPSDKRDYIGPAKYNVAESFSKNRDRKSFIVAEVAFNSSGLRSTTPAVKRGVPCSTTYENLGQYWNKGSHFAISPRFKCEEETPGPGSYNIHPRIEKSVYKAVDTHNLHLKENVLRKKLRTVAKDTRKKWLRTMRKKKLLNWFDVQMNYEERLGLLVQELFDKPL